MGNVTSNPVIPPPTQAFGDRLRREATFSALSRLLPSVGCTDLKIVGCRIERLTGRGSRNRREGPGLRPAGYGLPLDSSTGDSLSMSEGSTVS